MSARLSSLVQRLWPKTASRSTELVPVAAATALSQAATIQSADSSRLLAIFQAADDGLLACDAAGQLTLVNLTAAALLGVEPTRTPLSDWPERALVVQPALREALEEGRSVVEAEIERGDRTLQVEGRANRILGETGETDGAVLVLRDVTRLRELAASHSDDWAALAHDLKTPLSSIGGFTALLLQEAVGPLNPLQRDFLRTIEQEGQRLLESVQCFLEEARDGGRGSRLNCVEIALATVVEESMDRVRALALRRSVSIESNLPAELPSVEADRQKIGLVLTSLLDNAISFCPEQGQVKLSAHVAGDSLEIVVDDNGVGIPRESLHLVFGPFYRAPNQPSNGRPGVGLGLSICKQLVERHGGRIWAESGPAGGARILFTLPIVYRQAPLEALGAPA